MSRVEIKGSAIMAVAILIGSSFASADVQYLGSALIDGTGIDASGLTGTMEDGSAENHLDGFGSGIAYTGYSNRYVLLSDRGPNKIPYAGSNAVNNTLSYKCRFQIFDLPVVASSGGYVVSASLVGTSQLKNEAGQNFVGLSSQFTGSDPTANLRLDPESIRVAPNGTVYVSDEYGPSVYHFDANGNWLGALAVPEKFRVPNPKANSTVEIGSNEMGRVTSKGMEGLAITPDGRWLLGAMQAPLIQDGGDNTRYTRMVLFDAANPAAKPKEFLYKLDGDPLQLAQNVSRNSVCDVVAINDHQFLVDERDGGANVTKYAYVIDINGAQDISGIASLSDLSVEQLNAIVSVTKSAQPLVDIVAKTAGQLDNVPSGYTMGIPDKIEGFTFGPDLPDGRHLLLVTNDNDFGPSTTGYGYPNYVLAFAIDSPDLANFQPEQFTASDAFAPEPNAIAVFAVGVVMLRLRRTERTR